MLAKDFFGLDLTSLAIHPHGFPSVVFSSLLLLLPHITVEKSTSILKRILHSRQKRSHLGTLAL